MVSYDEEIQHCKDFLLWEVRMKTRENANWWWKRRRHAISYSSISRKVSWDGLNLVTMMLDSYDKQFFSVPHISESHPISLVYAFFNNLRPASKGQSCLFRFLCWETRKTLLGCSQLSRDFTLQSHTTTPSVLWIHQRCREPTRACSCKSPTATKALWAESAF